jgi:heat shock protein HspQ
MQKKIKLGQAVRCVITGFRGIATARVEYINGCTQYNVTPRVTEDGKYPDSMYIDVQQLEEDFDSESVQIPGRDTGGPGAAPGGGSGLRPPE